MNTEELVKAAEERWTTVRNLVWQGWASDISAEYEKHKGEIGDAGRWHIDTDGGVWVEAHPEVCDERMEHTPRWHPAEFVGHFYCTTCGAQAINEDGSL
jgi:hypothetical protein